MSSHSSGVSRAEITGLLHWEKALSVSSKQRGKIHALPLAPAAPPQATAQQMLGMPVSLEAVPKTGMTLPPPPHTGTGQCVPGYEATWQKNWEQQTVNAQLPGWSGRGDPASSTWCLLPAVNMSGTAGPGRKPRIRTPPPVSMSGRGCQSNLKNARLPLTNIMGRVPEWLQRQMPSPPEISWQRCHQPQLWTTPQAEISGWGGRQHLHTSPSFDRDLGHSCQIGIPGSLLRHAGFLMPVETKVRKALYG